jgi:hypothetical protein
MDYVDLAARSMEQNVMRDMWINQLNAAATGKLRVPGEAGQALGYLSTALCIIMSLSADPFRLSDWWRDQARKMALDFVEALDNGRNSAAAGSNQHLGRGASGSAHAE